MGLESIIAIILVGAIAGWLAGLIVKGRGSGFLVNMVVGILGAFVAGLVLPRIGLTVGGGIFSSIIHATVGAVILLVVLRLVQRGL